MLVIAPKTKNEFIRNVFLWTPRPISFSLSAKTYTHHLCADTGYGLKDSPGAMADRDRWWERMKGISAVVMPGWRWWGNRRSILSSYHCKLGYTGVRKAPSYYLSWGQELFGVRTPGSNERTLIVRVVLFIDYLVYSVEDQGEQIVVGRKSKENFLICFLPLQVLTDCGDSMELILRKNIR